MGIQIKSAALALALVVASGSAASADRPQHDESVALAAAKLAAEKIGEIRGSIDHDQKPVLVEPVKDNISTGTIDHLPRPAWVPEPDTKPLPPMVANGHTNLDSTMTGAIAKNPLPPVNLPRKITWDRFDKNGRPIKTLN